MPGVPPVPIPNTVVKPRAANGSRTIGPARVGCCQIYSPAPQKGAGLPILNVRQKIAVSEGPIRLDSYIPRVKASAVDILGYDGCQDVPDHRPNRNPALEARF